MFCRLARRLPREPNTHITRRFNHPPQMIIPDMSYIARFHGQYFEEPYWCGCNNEKARRQYCFPSLNPRDGMPPFWGSQFGPCQCGVEAPPARGYITSMSYDIPSTQPCRKVYATDFGVEFV